MNKNHLHFITYGDGTYPHIKASLRLAEQAKKTNWFNNVYAFNLDLIAGLDPSWYQTHKKFISENPRGNGYWIWKPKIIQLMLERIPENDVLIYLDGGSELNPLGEVRFWQYVDLAYQFNLMAFIADDPTYYKLGECTKKQLLDYFQISSEDDRILQLDQIEAGCVLIRNCETSRKFAREWLAIAEADDYIYLNDYLGDAQLPQFKDHRHDQSIFYMLMLRDKDFGIVIKNEDYFPSDWARAIHPKRRPIGLMRNISGKSRFSSMYFIDYELNKFEYFDRGNFIFSSTPNLFFYNREVNLSTKFTQIDLSSNWSKELNIAIKKSAPAFKRRQIKMKYQNCVNYLYQRFSLKYFF